MGQRKTETTAKGKSRTIPSNAAACKRAGLKRAQSHQKLPQLRRSGIAADEMVHNSIARVLLLVAKHPVCQKGGLSTAALTLDDQWRRGIGNVARDCAERSLAAHKQAAARCGKAGMSTVFAHVRKWGFWQNRGQHRLELPEYRFSGRGWLFVAAAVGQGSVGKRSTRARVVKGQRAVAHSSTGG